MNAFVLDGTINSRTDLGLRITQVPVIPTTERVIENIEVGGREGDLTLLKGWKDMTFSLKAAIWAKDVWTVWRTISPQILNAETISFSNDLSVFYKMKTIQASGLTQVLSTMWEFELEVTCSPFRYKANVPLINRTSSGTVMNNGNVYSLPRIKVYGSGTRTLTINGKPIVLNLQTEYLIIDSELNVFSSKIRCGDCGGWYGSKVWHSNTKYRRRVWRCNRKYANDDKCQTPHLTDDEVKELFVKAANQLIEIKDEVIRNFEEAKELLFKTEELALEQEKLEDTLNQLADEINALINENARIAIDQAEYERNYNALVKKFDETEGRLAKVKEEISMRQGKQEQVEMFLKDLESADLIDESDETLFNRLVEVIEVGQEEVTVIFKDGSEVTI